MGTRLSKDFQVFSREILCEAMRVNVPGRKLGERLEVSVEGQKLTIQNGDWLARFDGKNISHLSHADFQAAGWQGPLGGDEPPADQVVIGDDEDEDADA